MVHGAVKGLFQLLGIVVVGLLIALPLFAWRLSSGPIALDFLTPYIEDALSARNGGLEVRLDGTVLALASDSHNLEIRALNVRAYADGAENPLANVPELALTLNGRALLSGVVAPHSVRLYRPKVRLVRDEKGALQWGMGDDPQAGQSDNVVQSLIDALVGEPDPDQPGRYLQRVGIVDADLMIEDLLLDTTWHAPKASLEFQRVPDGVKGAVRLKVDFGAETGDVSADLHYTKADGGAVANLTFAGIRPALLARLGGVMAPLNALDMPLSGSVHAKGNALAHTVTEASVAINGGAGMLTVPDPMSMSHPVAAVALRGRVTGGLKQARLDELSIDFGGPRLVLSGTAEGLGGDTRVAVEATLTDVPFDSLASLWPAAAAPNPRSWVTSNMSAGIARYAHVNVHGRSPSGGFGDFEVESLTGELQGEGITVDYLHPMPPVKNAAAEVTFDASQFHIAVKGGEVYGLRVKDGTVVLGGLNQADQTADIDLTIAGPVSDALKLIDNKPLRYASALGIDPASAGGDATTRLRMKFPLLANLKLDDLDVKVHSAAKGVSLPKVVMDQDLSHADLELDVDTKGLDASGSIVLGTIPATLKWRENFLTKGVAFRSRYQVQAARVDEDQRKALGLDGIPFVSPYISGPVGASIVATMQGGGRADIDAKVDLTPARMQLPGLGWHKEDGTTGGAQVQVKLDRNKLAAIPYFVVNAGDLQTAGAVSFSPEGKIRRIDFSRLAYRGRTEVEGSIGFRGDALDIGVRGPSFDAKPLLSSDDEDNDGAAPQPAQGKRKKADLPPMTINAQVKKLWVSESGQLNDATIAMQRDSDDWRSMDIRGGVGQGKAFQLQLRQAAPNKRSVKVTSNDAGAVLRAFDTYEYMVGGTLDVDAAYDDSKDEQPLSGTIRITDYQIVNAPALARLLTVAALTGIVDVLKGQGISFSNLDAPFTFVDGLLRFKDTRAWGPALGITSKGEVDLEGQRVALEGTVVPAYALNSVLGNIPVLGWLVTGGEKGGGLLAFNYSMKGDSENPDVTVNPLSALTPGFLRNLFNIFDDGTETDARKRPESKPASPQPAPAPGANPALPQQAQ